MQGDYMEKLRAMLDLLCEKVQIICVILRLQAAMLKRRFCRVAVPFLQESRVRTGAVCKSAWSGARELYARLSARMGAAYACAATKALVLSAEAGRRIDIWRGMWRANQHFTFWLIPADGSHIAKTHIKKTHLRYALSGVAAFLVMISVTIGVLAHFAIQNETQKQEIAEFKATKEAQEQKIQDLQKMAEKNQKELAYLSKLEDKVRKEMAKNGTELPPKSDSSAYGKGGPSLGDASPVGYIMEQEKNISSEAKAKKADLEKLLDVIETENYRKDVTPSQWPTSGGEISSYFGGRANPFGGYGGDWHPGLDIANDYGAPVYAAAAGYVQQAGWYGGYGRYIRIGHDYGVQTAYGHMSSLAVSEGSYVHKGQVIGYVGSSGYSTGPHLHFEVLENGRQVNPLRYI